MGVAWIEHLTASSQIKTLIRTVMMAASTDRFADDTFISSASLDERSFYQRATWENVEICRSAQRQTASSVSILPSEIS